MKNSVKILSIAALFAMGTFTMQAQDVNNARGYVQVYDVASVNDLSTNEYKQYHSENDIADVSYLFWSNQGKMQVKIENKTNSPIYINWTKSTFTIEGRDLPLTITDESSMTEDQYNFYKKYKASDPTITDMDYEWMKVSMGGTIERRDEISEILSKSTYTKGNYYLFATEKNADAGVVLDTATASYEEKHSCVKNQKAVVYKADYTSSNSPVIFSCKLVVSTDKDFKNTKEITESFYVSSIREMDAKHFRGKKVGQTPEGYGIYKFPERKSTSFFIEINPRNSVEFNKRFAQ